MKMTILTTTEDEMDEVLNLEIPAHARPDVMALPGLQGLSPGLQEISLETAVQVAELFFIDLGDLQGVRCWFDQ